ncbi:MAG: TrkH family potassium uptake protein [Candidatus Hadarchaeales archaeon]
MLHLLGFMMFVIGGAMFVPAFLAPFLNELYLVPAFALPAVMAVLLGFLLRLERKPSELTLGNAMVVVTAVWLIFSAISSIPYVLVGMPLEDAYFESMSGFTATGLTMITNVSAMPMTMLFWRSFTQWIGGLGVVVLFLTAVVGFGRAARKLYIAEARVELLEPSIRDTARSLWKIYVALTVIGIAGLYIASLPNASLFEAVNHAMTGIATGGFSVRNDSFASCGTPALLVMVLIMMAGATSFVVHKRWMAGKWGEILRNVEVKLMLAIIALFTLVLTLSVGVGNALFQATSALTGTGFSTSNLATWGDAQKSLLTLLMIIGGGYGSTSSALKLIRMVILGKSLYWMIRKSFLPERAVVPMKIAGKEYSEREMMETALYVLIYIVVMIAGAVVLVALGHSIVDSMFESASAQGNVGLSVGITSPLMPLIGKVSLIIQMLVGRLEIIPVIAFLGYLFSKIPRPSSKPL